MAPPYTTTRSGSRQWMMQRVSALLLIVFAFLHFALQHFTTDANSTGLTVGVRLESGFWQSFYVVFILLAMYHGVNGVVGIIRDYAPKPKVRLVLEIILWTLAVLFIARGVINVVAPKISLPEMKEYYARHGFAQGESQGNPPLPWGKHYDFGVEMRSLNLFKYYLTHHTHRADDASIDLGVVFGSDDPAIAELQNAEGDLSDEEQTRLATHGGEHFDRWVIDQIAAGPPPRDEVDGKRMFSSLYEFAVWASYVRRANAERRHGDADNPVSARYAEAELGLPEHYDAAVYH